MSKTATAFIYVIYGLTLAVIVCSILVFIKFDFDRVNRILGYLPILIAVYCTTATLSRAYNLYLNNKESK